MICWRFALTVPDVNLFQRGVILKKLLAQRVTAQRFYLEVEWPRADILEVP
jgi:hypothetical protein